MSIAVTMVVMRAVTITVAVAMVTEEMTVAVAGSSDGQWLRWQW